MTDRQAILDEIIEFTTPPRLEEGEFTVVHYLTAMKRVGQDISRNMVYRVLDELVEEGVLSKRDEKVLFEGRWCYAYKRMDRGEGGG